MKHSWACSDMLGKVSVKSVMYHACELSIIHTKENFKNNFLSTFDLHHVFCEPQHQGFFFLARNPHMPPVSISLHRPFGLEGLLHIQVCDDIPQHLSWTLQLPVSPTLTSEPQQLLPPATDKQIPNYPHLTNETIQQSLQNCLYVLIYIHRLLATTILYPYLENSILGYERHKYTNNNSVTKVLCYSLIGFVFP